jgi:RNA recognition motif-containing protein
LQRIAYAKTKSDGAAKLDGTYNEAEVESRKQARREAHEAAKLAAAKSATGGAQAPGEAAAAGPAADATRTLFIENLPNEANEGMLLLVFQRFPGLKEVRMVPHKPGIAFVEYDNDEGAAGALAGLQGFKLATDKPMKLTYAKQ